MLKMPKGTTSACAENTVSLRASSRVTRNYLRVRGEYWGCGGGGQWVWNYLRVRGEYPPFFARQIPKRNYLRVRGEYDSHSITKNARIGTTSACAENTKAVDSAKIGNGNYLRVRGEYPTAATPASPWRELPPRARRIRQGKSDRRYLTGTTSACAENTLNELGLL